MRQRVDEINQLPPDFEETGAKEFAALPDEFNRGETKAKPPKKKPTAPNKSKEETNDVVSAPPPPPSPLPDLPDDDGEIIAVDKNSLMA